MKRNIGSLLVALFILFSVVGCVSASTTQSDNKYNLRTDVKLDNKIESASREVIDAGSQKIAIIDIGDGWKLIINERSLTNDVMYYNIYPSGAYAAWQHIVSQAEIEDVQMIGDRNSLIALLVKTKGK